MQNTESTKPQLPKTTDDGCPNMDDSNSLKAGQRGPLLLEDFIFNEKLQRFDRERIPERVVHARGVGAHGYFQVYQSLSEITTAQFLQDPQEKTPVFVRFSTVAGSRGSADTVRDVRGFATKFYTKEGNFDLVGNNIPVFFIQDSIQFPDLVHALKPHPHTEVPQAATAHDSFWDFISLTPESAHMIMWILSDRALPRSFSMMQGFGVHTFRMINEKGDVHFVKFHWKPRLGVHSLLFDELKKIAGKDPDFNRKDLYDNLEMGNSFEYELGLQVLSTEDADKLGFDILDSTKIIPEEQVPVQLVGRMVLNRNQTNFFAETEQVAFCVTNIVPGIDFSEDPLLQGRIMSYVDTQRHRLGGPNFKQLPINRPLCPIFNNNQDGFMQHEVPHSTFNYWPNSGGSTLRGGSGCPIFSGAGLLSYPERVSGFKERKKNENFTKDHYSQATLFWNSMSAIEKTHIIDAAHCELSNVTRKDIRTRMLDIFSHIDRDFALAVSVKLGIPLTIEHKTTNHGKSSPALSLMNTVKDSVKGRKVAILASDGVDSNQILKLKEALKNVGAKGELVSKYSTIKTKDGHELDVEKIFTGSGSVLYDAVIVAGGKESVDKLKDQGEAICYIMESFKHLKPIGAVGEGAELLQTSGVMYSGTGIFIAKSDANLSIIKEDFIEALKNHRVWERTNEEMYSRLPV